MEVGKKYRYKTEEGLMLTTVYTVTGITKNGNVIAEFDRGSESVVYSKNFHRYHEVKEPKTGKVILYLYESGKGQVFPALVPVNGSRLIATKKVDWTEGDES